MDLFNALFLTSSSFYIYLGYENQFEHDNNVHNDPENLSSWHYAGWGLLLLNFSWHYLELLFACVIHQLRDSHFWQHIDSASLLLLIMPHQKGPPWLTTIIVTQDWLSFMVQKSRYSTWTNHGLKTTIVWNYLSSLSVVPFLASYLPSVQRSVIV